VPVPLSPRLWGLSAASSPIVTLAERAPITVGTNVTEIVHVPSTASVAAPKGQSLVSAKSPALAPERPMLLIVSGAVPVFLSVDVCAPLVVPTRCGPKPILVGVRLTAGPAAAPAASGRVGQLSARRGVGLADLSQHLVQGLGICKLGGLHICRSEGVLATEQVQLFLDVVPT